MYRTANEAKSEVSHSSSQQKSAEEPEFGVSEFPVD